MRWVVYFCLLLGYYHGYSQDPRLAQQYYNDGEYEKAAVIYEQLNQKNPGNEQFLYSYLDCLCKLGRFSEAEHSIKKEINKRPQQSTLYVTYGKILESQKKLDEAKKQYKLAVDRLPADYNAVQHLAQSFIQNQKYDEAIQVFEKGQKLLSGKASFAYNLADLHRRKGDRQKMMQILLDGLQQNTVQVQSVQNILISYLNKDDFKYIQAQLYDRIQQEPEKVDYIELLQWTLVQTKDYTHALRQAKALDRKLNESGQRIYELATILVNEKDYRNAIDAFQYIMSKGPATSFYYEASRMLLMCRRNMIVENNQYTKDDLIALENDYERFKQEYGHNRNAAQTIIEYAQLEARYLNNVPKAIQLLEELIRYPIIDHYLKAQAKLDLGDYYLIQGERWEATLLYSQVDKDFKEDYLGEVARFKNAKLSYFVGDFAWAQEQFDILKQATSRLISNDAIDMSVFILDNLNQDSTGESLGKYAQAELKMFQNLFDQALAALDSVVVDEETRKSLEDDVWYLQAKIYRIQKRTEDCMKKYYDIIAHHKDGIRADNALYELAKIYDYELNQKEKALELYEQLFIDFSGSVLAVEARMRYRQLRGDAYQ